MRLVPLLVAVGPLVAVLACGVAADHGLLAPEPPSYAEFAPWAAAPPVPDAATPEEEPLRSEIPPPPRPTTTALSALPRFATELCPAGAAYEPLVGLHLLSATPDYLRLNGAYAHVGWRCAHATSPKDCVTQLDSRSFPRSVAPADSLAPRFFVAQTGDHIETIATWSQLARLLGPVDTLHEAALYATLYDYRIECGLSSGERVGNGWKLTATSGGGCGPDEPVAGHVLQVDANGKLLVLATMAIRVPLCQQGR